jgi:hypothetical protein
MGQGSAQGRRLSLTEPWGGLRTTCCEAENPGGRSTPRCGNMAAGRPGRPTGRKKTQTWTFAFFSTSRPPATAGGCPYPVEPLKDGFTTRVERSGTAGVNPSYLLLRGGSPAARGRDNGGRRHIAAWVRGA